MMIVRFLLFTVNIQNQRDNVGMMIILTDRFIFLDLLRLRTLKMRELGQMSFLWEMTPSRLMREFRKLPYLLLQTLNGGLMVLHISILLLGGLVEQMAS
jgi:hypothetical protein